MSEQGWRSFLAAEGMEDWVLLHGGATASFTTGSLAAAVHLAAAVAGVPGLEGPDTVLTSTGRRLTVRLTRDVWQLEPRHVEIARQVSAVAREQGSTADRTAVQEVQVAVSAHPDETDVGFWRAVLGYDAASEDNAVDPLGHGSTVWLQALDPTRPLRHAMHVDVSVAHDQVQARLAAALAAGGRVVADGEAPASWILSDRAGNRVCLAAWPDGARPRSG